jgi:hypothetical protein
MHAKPDDTWAALRRRRDLAMYTTKRLGRNRVVERAEPAPILLREPPSVIPPSQPKYRLKTTARDDRKRTEDARKGNLPLT